MDVRPATEDDLPGVVRIYNQAVEQTTATFDLGWGSFSSYTGWTDFDSTDTYDQDAQAMGRPDLLRTDFHSEGVTNTDQFSQELRFASSFDAPVNFTVGANYWEEERKLRDRNYISHGAGAAGPR